MPDVGRGGDVLGETPQPPGHPDALTPGRAERVIPKCFRLRPDGCVKRDHMRRQTRARRHIQFGIQLPRTNNSCEPDALQRHSLKRKHSNGHRSRFLRAPCSRRLLHSGPETSCCRLRKIIVIPKTIKLSWVIHFSYLPVSLSTKHTEPPKWRYYRDDVCCYWAEVLAYSMSDPPRYGPEAWKMKRKVHLGHSNFFVWEGRQRSGSKFWIKENDEGRKIRKKAGREIQWSPLPLEKTTSEAVGETKAGTEGQTK